MPKLPVFNVQHETLGAEASGGRRATAEDFGAGVGAALQGLGKGIQTTATSVEAKQEEEDARTVLMRNAQIREKYGKQLDEAETSGADTDPIRKALDDELHEVRSGLKTQRGIQYADQHSANTGGMFDGKTNTIKVERARAEAVAGGTALINSQANLIYGNPAYLEIAQQAVKDYWATQTGLAPHIRNEMAEKQNAVQRTLAAGRMAELDPEGTKEAIKSGKLTGLTPEQIAVVDNKADAELRFRQGQARMAAEDARTAKREASNAARDEHFKGIEAAKPGQQTDVYRAIMKDPKLDETDREHLVTYQRNLMKEKEGEGRKPNVRMENELMVRITAPDGDPRKITSDEELHAALAAPDGINAMQYRRLAADVAYQRDGNNSTVNQRRSEARNTIFRSLNSDPKYAAQPYLVADIMNRWDALSRDRMKQAREAKLNPATIFDHNDRNSITSPQVLAQIDSDARKAQGELLGGTAQAAAAARDTQTFPDGKTRTYTGKGSRTDMQNWTETVPNAAPAAPAAPTSARPTFNGVVVPRAAARGQSLEARLRSQYPRRRGEASAIYEARVEELAKRARDAGAE
ncbi:MAG: hypothetical protein ACREVR_12875 [Burkholderiales bacterium]